MRRVIYYVGGCNALQGLSRHVVDALGHPPHATATSEPANGGLGHPQDVTSAVLAVPLRSTLPDALASLAAPRHRHTMQEKTLKRGE